MLPATLTRKAALESFVRMPVTPAMISHLALTASTVIRCEPPSTTTLPTPPSTPSNSPPLPTLEQFITSLVDRSHVQVPTLMSSLVYLARLQRRLPSVAKGMRCTVHRIFLASLILAAKNLNDSSPKNKHWARYSAVRGFEAFGFSLTEVNLMEKQMLFLLDWDLRITNEDLYEHLEPFLTPIIAEHEAQHTEYYYYDCATPPSSGRSSRASDRSVDSAAASDAGSAKLAVSDYFYPTPPSTAPSSAVIPTLARSGSVSSVDSSCAGRRGREEKKGAVSGVVREKRSRGGVVSATISRFLAGASPAGSRSRSRGRTTGAAAVGREYL
ncbi:uncharacterized protein H6S33_010345 [Morchella sextelata]|uniref:uncharacterized protein n=1 Tax=Morchella sextelata TaxID=1174677 RepID=UPI001D03AFAA|nr:uncharacterized protein H6S33_010345 [Morchella sextelata]KAH0612293.1 hypothetical protein H6S33_010345 [Morchella sextelata]